MKWQGITGKRLLRWIVFCAVSIFTLTAFAADLGPHKPSAEDKCPVCGMFVYKYPDWVAEVVFEDSTTDFFDGAKDMFKYYFDLMKYEPGKSKADIAAVYVTEYYDMALIEAETAFFVVGSDVYGPMGRELIPFATREDAEVFKKDHNGRLILTFDQVDPHVIRKLDE